MLQYQHHTRGRETWDFNLLEDNNRYVQNWSVVQILVITFTTVLQVYFVRKLFDIKNVRPRAWTYSGYFKTTIQRKTGFLIHLNCTEIRFLVFLYILQYYKSWQYKELQIWKLIKHRLCTLQDCIKYFFVCLLCYQHCKQYSPILLGNGVLLSVIQSFCTTNTNTFKVAAKF